MRWIGTFGTDLLEALARAGIVRDASSDAESSELFSLALHVFGGSELDVELVRSAAAEDSGSPTLLIVEGDTAARQLAGIVLPSSWRVLPWPDGGYLLPMLLNQLLAWEVTGPMVGPHLDDVSAQRTDFDVFRHTEERLERALSAARMECWEWTCPEELKSGGYAGWSYSPVVRSTVAGGTVGTVHPDDRRRHQDAILRGISGADEGDYFCEFRVVNDDTAEVTWLRSRGRQIFNDDGRFTGMAGISIDVTREKSIEQELQHSQEWQRVSIEAGGLTLWRLESDTPCEFFGFDVTVNEANHSVTNWGLHYEDSDKLEEAKLRSLDTGEDFNVVYRMMSEGGGLRWRRAMGRRLFDEIKNDWCLVGAFSDVTENVRTEGQLRQALEWAREASKAKSSFLATMSHELRTPLNAVVGFSSLLAEMELAGKQRQFVDAISGSARHLLGMVSDILDLSRIEAGEMLVEQIDFDLHDCLEVAIDMVAPIAEEKGLCLLMTTSGPTHRRLRGDPMRIRQIASNLLSNAAKFTERGAIRLDVMLLDIAEGRRSSGREFELAFSVEDTGPGMSEEVQERLFQPFSQGDASTTRRYGGSGLGLSISRHLARQMGGELRVRSEVGVGSRFDARVAVLAGSGEDPEEFDLAGVRVALSVLSGHLESGLESMLNEWGASVEVCSPDDLPGWLDEDRDCDLLVVGEPLLHRLEGRASWPSSRNGTRLPLVVLGGFNSDYEERLHSSGARIVPTSRTIKPRRLFEALVSGLRVEHGTSVQGAEAGLESGEMKYPELRVLVAEDNEVNQLLLVTLLESVGIYPTVVATGVEVLDRFANGVFDVVLMDLEMPEMDGVEAARRIRDLDLSPQPYIVAVTAHVFEDSRSRTFRAGVNELVSKPVARERLLASLSRALVYLGGEAGTLVCGS